MFNTPVITKFPPLHESETIICNYSIKSYQIQLEQVLHYIMTRLNPPPPKNILSICYNMNEVSDCS